MRRSLRLAARSLAARAGAPRSANSATSPTSASPSTHAGPNCEVRTITFDDGSTLVIHESIVGVISPGDSSAAGPNAPLFLDITQTIVGGTGRFAGATGSGTERVNLAGNALITASGTVTLA